ncbi:MAG: hypothetical protein ACO3V2_09710, partial [Ilumatobacteraceae bacterium]
AAHGEIAIPELVTRAEPHQQQADTPQLVVLEVLKVPFHSRNNDSELAAAIRPMAKAEMDLTARVAGHVAMT